MATFSDDISEMLWQARKTKSLSQRELSERTGVPQSHISKIEKGAVDLRLSSLRAIANALDLEIALVPRKAMPAVKSIAHQTANKSRSHEESSRLEAGLINHIANLIPAIESRPRQENVGDDDAIEERLKTLIELSSAKEDAWERSIQRAISSSEPRPAYRLDDDDDA